MAATGTEDGRERAETGGDLLGRLLAALERELPGAVELRRRLHARPELAHAERETAAAVAAALPVAGEPVAGTGLLARVGPAVGPVVAVRAELDGLPLVERTGAPFAAPAELGAMHACGHDVHMAALVALARAVHRLGAEEREEGEEKQAEGSLPASGAGLPAALLAVFQPSEEAYPSGAAQLAGPLADRGPLAVVGAHVHPELPWGAVALDPGAVNASCDVFEVVVEGAGAHGAYPHRGRDPVLALAEVVVALHAQLGRLDPLAPATLTVSMLEGARAENVIPAWARARGALRAQRPAERAALRELLERVAAGVAGAHGCGARVTLTPGEPALENDPALVTGARALLPAAGLVLASPFRSCGSDDFAFFGAGGLPLAMAFVGLEGAPGFEPRPLHHPELLVPDAAVGAVARAQAVLFCAAARVARR